MAKEIRCREAGYDCDFMIRSEREDELVEFVQDHAMAAHDANLSESDVKDIWRTV